jgi:arabinogalactan endo-1,4-beta-galactosidase
MLFCLGSARGGEFLCGADFSQLAFFEARGVTYKVNGQPEDAFQILKRHGCTCVRLRLFTSSAEQARANPYNYGNNLEYTLPLAARVKKAGLSFLLDIHYSDTWADPGKQRKPTAWTNLAFPELSHQVRSYSSNCIVSFRRAGAVPDYVQVGNEIIGGMLWPDGRVGGAYDTPAQWSRLAQLLASAMAGIREAAGDRPPKIIIHIDRGGDWGGTKWFFDHLQQQQVQFDIIGQSYYPWWHGSLEALRTCLAETARRYEKPVLLVETAFPWANSTNLCGIAAGPEGQVAFVAALAEAMRRIPERRGAGIVWWGAEYQSVPGIGLAGFDKKSLFDSQGDVLPAAEALGKLGARRKAGSL